MKKATSFAGSVLVVMLCSLCAFASDDGPVAWWKFEEGKDKVAVDSASQREDAIGGNFKYVEGVSGACMKFDGYSTHIARESSDVPQLTDAFTIEAWVALQTYPWNWTAIVNQGGELVSSGEDGVPTDLYPRFFLGIDAKGHVGMKLGTNGQQRECTSQVALPLLEWSHVVGTFGKDSGMNLYVNGKQSGSLAAKDLVIPAKGHDLFIGRSSKRMYPFGTERDASKRVLSRMMLDGLIDEVKIYNRALSAAEVRGSYTAVQPSNRQPLTYRAMPTGPKGPGRFGAYYCKLKYSDEWDNLWRVGPYADILVRFDESPVKVVFWRGTNYGPGWVAENGKWMTDESFEGGSDWGCNEHMSDKQCRYSHVRIVENNDARIVIHWRYACTDIRYFINNPNPETGWGDWADEYYTIYPDLLAVRKMVLWSDVDMEEFGRQETIFFNQPGTRPEDNVDLEAALTLVNMKGEMHTYSWIDGPPEDFDKPDEPNIQMTNLKAKNKPFIIFVPGTPINNMWYEAKTRDEMVHFPFWNHWPVAQVPNEGRNAVGPDRPSHSSLAYQRAPHVRGEGVSQTIVSLYGMTENPVSTLVPLAHSWIYPAQLSITGPGFAGGGYDKYQRAYVLDCESAGRPSVVKFELAAGKDQPIVNPAFVIKNWGEAGAELKIDGKKINRGKDFRFGHNHTLEGSDLIVWVKTESTTPVQITLSPAAG
jgi:hypothetical protein